MIHWRPWVCALWGAFVWAGGLLPVAEGGGSAEVAPPTIAEAPAHFAVLVGIEEYAKLGPGEQLNGSCNDVHAMRSLLEERFGFRAEDIVMLTNHEATAAAVRGAFGDLVERVRALPPDSPPAQVVFHFSGHGSQVCDQDEGHPDCDEEDGLDETLVCADAERQGGSQDLRDDELHRFAEAVCEGGRARLWVVLDCCHSGTGLRGATKIRRLQRDLPPAPAADAASRAIRPKTLPAGVVFLSACRSCEVEPEYQEADESYGLLTRFLVQVLQESQTVSKLSYQMLPQAIATRYCQERTIVQAPTPQLEGGRASLRGVDTHTDGPLLGPDDPDVPQAIRESLSSIQRPDESSWLTWVEGSQACDVLLRIDRHEAALFPATGITSSPQRQSSRPDAPDGLRGGWGPVDLHDPQKAANTLQQYLRRIARARNLIRLAAAQECQGESPIRVELELLSVKLSGYDPQPGLPPATLRSSSSSLGRLLLEQTYFQTRGARRLRPRQLFDDTWSATTLRWDVVPQPQDGPHQSEATADRQPR